MCMTRIVKKAKLQMQMDKKVILKITHPDIFSLKNVKT